MQPSTPISASIMYIVQPIGNVLSGIVTESVGRRGAILIINIIPAIAWILLPNAQTTTVVYIGFSMLGIWSGLSSSVSIYVSEIRYGTGSHLQSIKRRKFKRFGRILFKESKIWMHFHESSVFVLVNHRFGVYCMRFVACHPQLECSWYFCSDRFCRGAKWPISVRRCQF